VKELIQNINATPSKRLYLSIVADYHLELGLCELIDNAIDNWIINGKPKDLEISINLDYERQIITVKDNSGGISENDISLIVSPGLTRKNELTKIIGVFGVGSKRAVVALAEEVKIYSRYNNQKTLLVELDNNWINEEDNWHLPAYEVDPIEEGTTYIELVKLRDQIIQEHEDKLKDHLSATYAAFIDSGRVRLVANGDNIPSRKFDMWSFPSGFEPKQSSGPIDFGEKGKIDVCITGGLTQSHRKTHSSSDEYGVYFYCNDRLISRAYKGPEVGFRAPRIGGPHPSKSLARVVVSLSGPVELMPWNSSKSEIDFKHKTFREIEKHIERMLFSYVSASKNFQGEWPAKVFSFTSGVVYKETLSDISRIVKIHTPSVPRGERHRKYADILKLNNKLLVQRKPWVIGTYETEIAVEQILQLKLEQNYRISMLLLDSALEIAFKDFLVNDSGTSYSETRLSNIMKDRIQVHSEIKNSRVKISQAQWKKIEHFYRLRCDLVHKRSTVSISQNDLEVFRETYKYVIEKLFNVDFSRELRM
jgi:hypothetical protein